MINCPNCSQQLTKIEGGYRCDNCLARNAWPSLFYDEEFMQQAETWLKWKAEQYTMEGRQ